MGTQYEQFAPEERATIMVMRKQECSARHVALTPCIARLRPSHANSSALPLVRTILLLCLHRNLPTMLAQLVCGLTANASKPVVAPSWRWTPCSLAWCTTFCLSNSRRRKSRANSSACGLKTLIAPSRTRAFTTVFMPCLRGNCTMTRLPACAEPRASACREPEEKTAGSPVAGSAERPCAAT